MLEKYDIDVPLRDLQFLKATFWVQVHDIPIHFMTKAVAEEICDIVGDVCHLIGGVDEDGGSYIRVKVTLDISLPLCRSRLVSFENGKQLWVQFKYEHLRNICY